LGVSRQGEFKNTIQIFLQKVPCRIFSENSDKISRLFLFYRVFGCFSAMGVQKHRVEKLKKKFLQKNRVEKFLQKIRPKIQTDFFSNFCLSRFWAFLDEGSSKTR
jgi:hypothetical protein